MQNNWEPYIGQKVKCVKTPYSRPFRNPTEDCCYVITAVCDNGKWVTVSGFDDWWYLKSRFAPITEQYSDATAEIIEKFKPVEETADQPVRVLETN